MPDGFTIKVDASQMNATLAEYMKYTKRNLVDVIDSKVGDWAYEAAKIVKTTTKAAVEAFRSKPYFWQYIQKVLRTKGFGWKTNRRAKGAEVNMGYRDLSSGKWHATRKWVSVQHEIKGEWGANYTTKQKEKAAKSLIRRRVGRIKALRVMLLYVAGQFGKNVRSVGHKQTPGASAGYRITGLAQRHATPDKLSSAFSLPLSGKPRETGEGNLTARAASQAALIQTSIMAAQGKIVKDMQTHIAGKLAEKGREVSGK